MKTYLWIFYSIHIPLADPPKSNTLEFHEYNIGLPLKRWLNLPRHDHMGVSFAQ